MSAGVEFMQRVTADIVGLFFSGRFFSNFIKKKGGQGCQNQHVG